MPISSKPVIPTFFKAIDFLTSWGLHFETPEGESNDIPYPHVYLRMRADAEMSYGEEFSNFCGMVTETTDGRTYLTVSSWDELEEEYNKFYNKIT
jgi:hypothetical protein